MASYLYPPSKTHQPLPQDDPSYSSNATYSSPSLSSPSPKFESKFSPYSSPPQTLYDPMTPDPSHPHHAHYQTHRLADTTRKRRIRILKLVSRLGTLGLALYGVASQALTLEKYLTTRNIIRDGRDPWAKDTYLWPTILLLSTSALTVLVSLATIVSYLFSGVKGANRVSSRAGVPMTVTENLAHLAVWIATAIGYKLGKTGSDLWGWSCDPKADAIQEIFPEVNFSFFCGVQTGSWVVSLAQVVLVAVTVAVWAYAWRRERRRKEVRRSMGVANGQGLGVGMEGYGA